MALATLWRPGSGSSTGIGTGFHIDMERAPCSSSSRSVTCTGAVSSKLNSRQSASAASSRQREVNSLSAG